MLFFSVILNGATLGGTIGGAIATIVSTSVTTGTAVGTLIGAVSAAVVCVLQRAKAAKRDESVPKKSSRKEGVFHGNSYHYNPLITGIGLVCG